MTREVVLGMFEVAENGNDLLAILETLADS